MAAKTLSPRLSRTLAGRLFGSSCVAVLALAAASASACPGKTQVTAAPAAITPSFDTLDRNSDDRLSRTEASLDRRFAEMFAYRDTDGDGFVSRTEFALLTNGGFTVDL